MTINKIKEASLAGAINGFLSNQKENVAKRQKGKRVEEFWKVVTEGILREAAPRKDAEDPDDWRQRTGFGDEKPSIRNLKDEDEEEGTFSSKSGQSAEEEVKKSFGSEEGPSGQKRSKNRTAITPQELNKRIDNALAILKKRNPEEYEKIYGSKNEQEKRAFEIRLGKTIREKGGTKIEKGTGDTAKGGAVAKKNRVDIVTGLVTKVLDKASHNAVDPSRHDKDFSVFARNFLGLDLRNPNISTGIVEKFRLATPEQQKQISSAIATKALENPKTALPLIKFMNSRLDMYPHDWMDQMEEMANKSDVPSVPEDKNSGMGFGVKRLGDEAGTTSSSRRQNPTMASKKRAEDWIEKTQAYGREDLGNKVVGRTGIGDSAIHRLFSNVPMEDILRYADYFEKNPQEIERSKEERRNPPPNELDELMGKLPSIGSGASEKYFRNQEIGGSSDSSPIVAPEDLGAAKKDYASKLAKFKSKKSEEQKTAEEHGNRPSRNVSDAGMQYEKPFDLDYKNIFKNMTDIGTFDKPKKIPGLTSKVINDLANRFNLSSRVTKNPATGEVLKVNSQDQTSPEQIIDVIKKLAQYDDKNRYKGLATDLENRLAPEEMWVGKELVRVFNPKRMDKDAPKGEDIGLKSAFSNYAGSELEKLVANIPARNQAMSDESRRQSREAEEAKRRLEKEKSSTLSPEQAQKMDQERQAKRDELHSKIKSRAGDLEQERTDEEDKLNKKVGDKEEFENLRKNVIDLGYDMAKHGVPFERRAKKLGPVSDEILNKRFEKALEKLSPIQLSNYEKMSDEQKENFKNTKISQLRQKEEEKRRKSEENPSYDFSKDEDLYHAMNSDFQKRKKKRSIGHLKTRENTLNRKLKQGKSMDPTKDQMELSRIMSQIPHASRVDQLKDIDAKSPSLHVPARVGPTTRPTRAGIDAVKRPTNVGPRPYQKHDLEPMPSLPMKTVDPETAERMIKSRRIPQDAARLMPKRDDRPSPIDKEFSPEEAAEKEKLIGSQTYDLTGKGAPEKIKQAVGSDARYKTEPSSEFRNRVQKTLITNLFNDARKKLAKAGMSPSAKTMMQYIAHNFDTKKYPEAYNKVKDLILSQGESFMTDRELKTEGKSMKLKKLSLLELLTSIDSDKVSHVDAPEEEWEKAAPEKKMNFTPKFDKQKKPGK